MCTFFFTQIGDDKLVNVTDALTGDLTASFTVGEGGMESAANVTVVYNRGMIAVDP